MINFRNGFTLTEIVVILAVLAIVGVILSEAFFLSIRGSNKAQILAKIKQNGQTALELIDKTIRGSNSVAITCSFSGTLTDTIILFDDGIFKRFRFAAESPGINGRIVSDEPPLTPSQLSDNIALTTACVGAFNPASSSILTDSDVRTGVSVLPTVGPSSNYIILNQSPGYRDTVTIQFRLKPAVQTPLSLSNQIEPITFQTTVELR